MKDMRNHVLRKLPVFALAAGMVIGGSSLSAFAEAAAGSGMDTLLDEFQGTYTALFPAFRDDRYDSMWEKSLSEYAGIDAENTETVKDAFLSMYESDIHGEEAQKKAEEEPGWFMFDCSFGGQVNCMTFDGNRISGIDKDGNEVFNNTYEYFDSLKKNFDPMTDMYMAGVSEEDWPLLHIFVSDGPDDEFKYFAFADDTPAETYHLEFRYGSDPEDLCRYFSGPYGYWMVSATYKDCDDEMMENCIDLFVEENADSIKAIAESFSGNGEETAFAGGSGTEEDPWQIANAQQLTALSDTVNDGSAGGYPGQYFALMDDIDLTGISWQPIGHMDLEDMNNTGCMFLGTFDGQGHTISNVSFQSDYPITGVGVIGMNCGEVKDLIVENVNINCTDLFSMAIGGVVGYNMGSVHDVILAGNNEISGVNCTGGIVGGNMGAVYNCSVEQAHIHVLGDNDFSSGRIIQEDVAECGGLVIGGSFGGSIDNCRAKGTVSAEGNEPVGLGGIAGCLEMMDTVTNCTADVTITTTHGGHAIGGLCGFSGTHSNGMIVADTEGIVTTEYPGIIDNCSVTVKMDVPGATHVGGLVGTGLYYFGEETAFKITDCSVDAEINGAVTPGSVAGRAENSVIESCEVSATLDGEALTAEVGETDTMYESADQLEEEPADAENTEAGEDASFEDDTAKAEKLLEDIKGTYEPLFPIITAPQYDQLWLDPCIAAVGEEAAPEVAEMLKSACSGTVYGQEAIDAFGDGSEGAQFDCLFINGPTAITFNGNTISGTDENGDQLFSHEYRFVGSLSLAGMMEGYLYETDDEDAGEFRYFYMMPDTPATTYHLEFRYGSDIEALSQYNEGPYAYWLAAGFPVDADEEMIENVITLFCEENLAEMQAEEAA